MRDSPILVIVPELQKAGAKIQAFDPQGMQEAKKFLNNIKFSKGPYEAMEGADALVIITEFAPSN